MTPRAPKSREEWLATFGRRLRVLRLWNGLSEAQMARTLGISIRSLKRREAGATVGSRGMTHVMIAAAETFGVSIDWLHDLKVAGAYRDDTRPLAPDGKPLAEILEAVP
jgi:transcriptional regulator with XRE-family HTH domain